MEKQFEYLVKLAKKYQTYEEDDQALFDALQSLDRDKLNSIYEEYGDPNLGYEPVNMLRAEVAGKLLNGDEFNPETVEIIKGSIIDKKTRELEYLPQEQLDTIESSTKKTDAFSNWKRYWSLFHTFFYRDAVKETVRQYLKQISNDLIIELDLPDYKVHFVDFNGVRNLGRDFCWLALYPASKESHKEAYQFFIRFSSEPKAGLMAGRTLKDSLDEGQPEEKLENVSSYAGIVEIHRELKEEILQRNQGPRNYFKFSPGSQAIDWDWFKEEERIGVGYKDLGMGDISDAKSRQELNEKAGLPTDSESNQTWNTWLFKTAKIGDVVFANQGVNKVLGIGIITGEYEYHEGDKYPHQRKMKWLTTKVYEYKSETYQNYTNLFRPDTFSPTKTWQFIFNEYVRLYPELSEVFDKHDLDYSTVDATTQDIDSEIDEQTETNYWWLNANPSIWSLSDQKVGDRQTYTSRNEKGNKRRIYKYFESVQPGDLIIGYESSPSKQIRAIMQITEELHQSEDEGEVIEFEVIEKLEVPVSWNELKSDPSLKDCEVFINNQGSLFSLTEEEYDIIRATIDQKNISEERKLESSTRKPYDFDEDPDKPFLSRSKFDEIISILQRKKNIILQGPPGVGKTFIARKLAYQIMGYENDSQIEVVQFHQSYSYEDFIQGLRITESGTNLRNGIFYEFCQKAHTHKERDFFIIIDEINRGNLSKIFGELLMLIEADKRDPKFATKLTYAEDEEDTFYVPPNLHLIGTMNTADRSLSIIDYALRRRFAFISLEPKFEDNFLAFLDSQGISQSLSGHIQSSIKKVNKVIKQDLNEGFRIGHSYFCTFENNQSEDKWYQETIEYEIKPLLEEIWFDNSDQVKKMYEKLSR